MNIRTVIKDAYTVKTLQTLAKAKKVKFYTDYNANRIWFYYKEVCEWDWVEKGKGVGFCSEGSKTFRQTEPVSLETMLIALIYNEEPKTHNHPLTKIFV